MHAAALRVELRLPAIHSLKEKRHRLKLVTSSVTSAFDVAVSEVGHQDSWQRATLGIAVVAPQAGHLDRILHKVTRRIGACDGVEILETAVSHLERPE